MELAQELTRIRDSAQDFIVPTEKLEAAVIDGNLKIGFRNGTNHAFDLNNWSTGQVASYTEVPKQYLDRIAIENKTLAADSINHGLQKQAVVAKQERRNESRMLRTVDGHVRGMLSSRYRIMDSHDLLETIFPVLMDKGLEVVSSEITEQRLYLKALSPKLETEVKKGDVVQYGITISTSDVGGGAFRVEPMIYRLACLNGMISSAAIKMNHSGKNQAEEDVRELLSDETKSLDSQAFWSRVRDVTLSSLLPENFEREVDRLRIAANMEIKNFDLPRVVELTMKATGVTGETKKNSILAALASGNEGAGLTQWGLINSFTKAAQDNSFSYEDSIQLERAGGLILNLPKSQWSSIAAVSA